MLLARSRAALSRLSSTSSTSAGAMATTGASLFKLKAIETVELVPGHLTKEIVMQGSGSTPQQGNTVTAHYTGKLVNASDFDSSRTRGKPFQFKIGIGQVIKGWDVGMATMKVGERAVFSISSDYGYGDEGYEPVIPGGAKLFFDVEMLKFAK